MSIRAFAPANISCIFKPIFGKDELHTGSIGLGFTLNEGVTVEISFSNKTEIFFNNKSINFPTVVSVINFLTTGCHPERPSEARESKDPLMTEQEILHGVYTEPVGCAQNDNVNIKIAISTPLPLGCGFGISGASALATAYAFNELLNLNKAPLELAKIAHVAEVENGTGLGDVTNQYLGGCLLKTKPSYMFEAQRLPFDGIKVYCKVFSSIESKKILSDASIQNKIAKAADEVLLGWWQVERSEAMTPPRWTGNKDQLFPNIIQISKQFALQSGLLKNKEVNETILKIEKKGRFASMIMLGNAVFSNISFNGAREYKISNNKASIIL